MEPHRGTLILILGILGLVSCGPFTAIPAWIMGNTDLAKMRNGTMDPSGESLTNIGRILGMIECILTLVSIVILVVMMLLFGGAMFMVAGKG
jgi:hypothetical protein